MKFVHQYDKSKPIITVELDNDATLPQAIEAFKSFLLAVGYTPENVQEYLGDQQ